MQWHPIDSAPKDGREVYLKGPLDEHGGEWMAIGVWEDGGWHLELEGAYGEPNAWRELGEEAD
ncbi:hypothetical protein [Methylobacterium nigriterrae]|uniref:hypothetical protein n=1 Tax=Methylobacterium nigriterrae TaxID=3127512 RepID=UPI003013A8A6